MRRIFVSLAALCFTSTLSYAQARNPIGEKAVYGLDTNRQRTSLVISSGNFLMEILPDSTAAAEPSYDAQLTYSLTALGQEHNGKEIISVTENFFDPQFMVGLRESKHYESAKFKIEHLGFKDATTIYRNSYPHCDYVRLYDIDTTSASMLTSWITAVMSQEMGKQVHLEDIENLEIWAHVHAGIPTLGAVKLDVKGKFNGINIKFGADYKPN